MIPFLTQSFKDMSYKAGILYTHINTYKYNKICHYIIIVRRLLLVCSPDILFQCLFKYIHRRTIFNMILHVNIYSQFGTNITECVLSGIGITIWHLVSYMLSHIIVE